MTTLKILRFSCFEKAEITLNNMTLLIGPQASGKSVISKLYYFFNQLIQQFPNYAEERNSSVEMASLAAEEFRVWFPPQAWGGRPFKIVYEAGLASIVIVRRRSTGGPSDRVNIKFSEFLTESYEQVLAEFDSVERTEDASSDDLVVDRTYELTYRIRYSFQRSMQRELADDYVASQLFVPAGRSFFTTIGKAVAVFDQGNVLDPVTRRFGRLFAALRDRGAVRFRASADEPPELAKQREALMHDLFGGAIRFGRDTEYVEAADGRRIPFSILSSGQQELLPLWLALGSLPVATPTPRARLDSSLVYIEEPEAHLFPTAQSQLFDYLASLVANPRIRRRMLITTHSPYLLSKANNLILASRAAFRNKRKRELVEDLIDRTSLMPVGSISAYAIENRTIRSLLDDDGLIDGDYLDSVSDQLSEEFLKLLEISGHFE